MFTSLTETNPASEYQNSPSRSSVFNGFSINYDRYLVSRILADEELSLVNSNSESIEQVISVLQKCVSILRGIDRFCTMSTAASNYVEPSTIQLPKWYSLLAKKSGLGSCYADRDTDTLNNGGKCDRRFANKESDAIVTHSVAIVFLTSRSRVCDRFGGL